MPASVIDLVPHKPPMLIVERLVDVNEEFTLTEMRVSHNTPFVSDRGKLDNEACVEIIAQSIAAHEGYHNIKSVKPLEGFLTGIKRLKIYGTASVGDKLSVKLHKIAELDNVALIRGDVFRGDTIIAAGEIKVWSNKEAL